MGLTERIGKLIIHDTALEQWNKPRYPPGTIVSPENGNWPDYWVKPDEVKEWVNHLTDVLLDTKTIVVTAACYAGAGHKWQELLEWLFLSKLTVTGENGMQRVNDQLHRVEVKSAQKGKLYPFLQEHLRLFTLVNFVSNHLVPHFIGDQVVDRWHETLIDTQPCEALWEKLTRRTDFDPDPHSSQRIVVFSTHVAATKSFEEWAKNKGLGNRFVVLQAIPDPWKSNELRQNSIMPRIGTKDVAIVHNTETAHRLAKRYKLEPRQVAALGTISPAELLRRMEFTIPEQPHILISLSGNRNKPYEQDILRFIESTKQELVDKKILLTVHVMTHTAFAKDVTELISRLNIPENQVNIVTVPEEVSEESKLESALMTRYQLMTGRYPGLPRISAHVWKGEGPITPTDGFGILCPRVGGHELLADAITGYLEGISINPKNLRPETWYQTIIRAGLDQMYGKRPFQPQSFATVAALLKIIDPEYYQEKVAPAILQAQESHQKAMQKYLGK